MFPHQYAQRNPYPMYNMYPFAPYYNTQSDYFQPFQMSFMNGMQQPASFYPPRPPFNPYTPYPASNKKYYKKQQQGQLTGIMSQFKTPDGNYDINKMMNTAGQMMNAMNQVSGLVKQVGGFFLK